MTRDDYQEEEDSADTVFLLDAGKMDTYRRLFTRNNLPLPDNTAEWDTPSARATSAQFHAFLAHVEHTFSGNPSLRTTLVKCIQQLVLPRLEELAPVFVQSAAWTTLLRSTLLDVNAQLFASSIKLALLVIPYAPAAVSPHVPTLLAVLVRTTVWKKRAKVYNARSRWGTLDPDPAGGPINTVPSSSGGGFLSWRRDPLDSPVSGLAWTPDDPGSLMTSTVQAESLADITPAPHPSLGWRVAGAALSGSSASGEAWAQPASVANPPPLLSPPASDDPAEQAINTATHAKLMALSNPAQDLSRGLLLELYGSWPVNVIELARDPAGYLEGRVESPYVLPWGEVWRKKEVVELLSTALAGFLFNPSILLSNAAQELHDTPLRTQRLPPTETIAQTHALWLGSILPRASSTSLLAPTSPLPPPGRQTENRTAQRDTSPTETLSSSGGSVTGRYHRAPTHRRTSEFFEERDTSTVGGGAVTIPIGPTGTYISSQTAPINIHTSGKTHGGTGGGAGAGVPSAGGDLQAEVDGLRREKEFLEMDLRYSKVLAASYLQHVYRLHEKVIAVITDEAERQNIYNQLKEQTSTIRSLRDELRIQRAAVDRAKESIAKMQTEQRETRQIQREEKKARALETSLSRAEIEDQTRILEAQKLELARVKDAHFKLDNKLREAEPKIKHIADYEKQVDKLYHNQLLWDADVRKQKETETSLSKMMSAFKQMEIVLSRYEKDKKALQAETQRQADRMAEMQGEISHLLEQLETPKALPDDIASTMRQDLEILQTKLQEARRRIDTLEADKLDLEARVEQLEYQRMTAASAQATLL